MSFLNILIVLVLISTCRPSRALEAPNTSHSGMSTSLETTTQFPMLFYPDYNHSESEFENSSDVETTPSASEVLFKPNGEVVTTEQATTSYETVSKTQQENASALEIVNITAKSGFIQSRNWNSGKAYGDKLDSWITMTVPEDHVVMLSFTDIEVLGFLSGCPIDAVRLYLGNTSRSNLIWKACETSYPIPEIYNTERFYIRFRTRVKKRYTRNRQPLNGFRLHFSFHNNSARPEKLPDGLWNCSVPFWEDFQKHLNCNLELECSDGRDEAACFYSSDLCRQGSFRAGNSCFMHVDPRRKIKRSDAKRECYERGGMLAGLATSEVWSDVVRVLRRRWVIHTLVGLEMTSFTLPDVYQNIFQWDDGTIAYYMRMRSNADESGCAVLLISVGRILMYDQAKCNRPWLFTFLCQLAEKEGGAGRSNRNDGGTALISINETSLENGTSGVSVVKCPEGHVTHAFLACDEASSCWASKASTSRACSASLTPLPPSFTCNSGVQHVPYSLVCDHRADCGDRSDEDFCQFAACHWSDFQCGGKQCIPDSQVCDQQKQCINGIDEAECREWRSVIFYSHPAPAVVNFDRKLYLNIAAFNTSSPFPGCPDSHFQCGPDGYCLPVFVRCNGVPDCPGRADEKGCEEHTCSGFYRCRSSQVCLHPDHLCDGVSHCPQRDDELFCHLDCPPHCVCYGWAFFCSQSFIAGDFLNLRFLDAKHSMMKPFDVQNNSLLVYLSLANCGLQNLQGLTLSNLRTLDITDNQLRAIQTIELSSVPNLRELYLTGNPLAEEFLETDRPGHFTLPSLHILDLGRTSITNLNTSMLLVFPYLQTLNFSGCGIRYITNGFGFLPNLQAIDLRGSNIAVLPRDLFSGISDLRSVYADNFKLCCPDVLPSGFNVLNCHAPRDEISSCGDLLRSNFYRILLFVLAGLAILGNIGSFILRTHFIPNKALAFGVLVTHLCASDFLMGVYLLIIGIADQTYRGTYLWKDTEWKNSAVCKLAGFFSFLSNEVSALIICLITIDRFVALRFPLSRFHLSKRSAHVACVVIWTIGFILAAVPLLPLTSHWDFYGQTGICIPLPITRQEFAGHDYSFGVMIILNFVLFILIAMGQIFIYWSIKQNAISAASCTKASNDMTIARRLITIAVTDFLCWFPIGLLGLLASSGFSISGELNVALAIVALPLNSAINPFLYTLNTILERRRKAKEQRLRKSFVSQTNVSAL